MLYGPGDILDWQKGKAARGWAVAQLDCYDRRSAIASHAERKREIREKIKTYSLDMTMRRAIFDAFDRINIYRTILRKRLAGDPEAATDDYMSRIARLIDSIRTKRFNNGNPLVFTGRPFWSDPLSKYVPEDYVPVAAANGVEWHTMRIKISLGRAIRLTQEIEGRRNHCGLWAIYVPLDDEIDGVQCAFESITDMIEFRFRYDFEIIS